MICREVSNINNYAAIINRNTPYFNHTRNTVNKVSTLLIQTAELACSPTPWRAALGTSSSVKFVTHFINSTNR